jgi:hypothetical protein
VKGMNEFLVLHSHENVFYTKNEMSTLQNYIFRIFYLDLNVYGGRSIF